MHDERGGFFLVRFFLTCGQHCFLRLQIHQSLLAPHDQELGETGVFSGYSLLCLCKISTLFRTSYFSFLFPLIHQFVYLFAIFFILSYNGNLIIYYNLFFCALFMCKLMKNVIAMYNLKLQEPRVAIQILFLMVLQNNCGKPAGLGLCQNTPQGKRTVLLCRIL